MIELELCMIVRNSGEVVLRKSLSSIKHYISNWTIVDTGSTDNTCYIIQEELTGVPGNLYHRPPSDFSNMRNEAIQSCSRKCKYIIMLDDSYELHGGTSLNEFLGY